MIQELRNELESRRVDSAQLERMARAINAAMPSFSSVMGSECDHAEQALAEMVKQRNELAAALHQLRRFAPQPAAPTRTDGMDTSGYFMAHSQAGEVLTRFINAGQPDAIGAMVDQYRKDCRS